MDVVQLLLSLPDVDVSITNRAGETALSLAKNDKIASAILTFTGTGIVNSNFDSQEGIDEDDD